jgi:NADH:ubiquinone oxidoreductase subunit F (NADH-binding)
MTTMETVRGSLPLRGTSRLIENGPDRSRRTLQAHLDRHGALPMAGVDSPEWSRRLLGEIERAALTGRGGAGFPSAKKLRRAQSTDRRPVLLANAMEGEPASAKDRFLITHSPHLVLDGADLVASAVHAGATVLCVPHDGGDLAAILGVAIEERSRAGYSMSRIAVRPLSGRYVAGEESALAAAIGGDRGLPRYRPDKSIPLRVGRQPALVHNVETLAHVALIARYGADWFAQIGAPEAPGTCLVTVSGAVERPGVVEVVTGTAIGEILQRAQPLSGIQAAVIGGYGGTWLPRDKLAIGYAPLELKRVGASMGAGVLVAIGRDSCGIRETELIARFMAAESAGQCGPCLFGLPAIAADLGAIADGVADATTLDRLLRRCAAVAGRGACAHPDGVVRLVRSALGVFAADLESHLQGFPCAASSRSDRMPVLPLLPGGCGIR